MKSLIALLALATAAVACPPEQQSAPVPQQRVVRLVAASPVRKVIRYVPVVEEAPAPVLVVPVEVRRTKPTPVRDFLFGR
jgi:hypothetical protein